MSLIGDMIIVPDGDRRPVWVIAREWYLRVAAELDAIVKEGGVRTARGLLEVSASARKRAARQAEIHRRAAEQIARERPEFEEVRPLEAA